MCVFPPSMYDDDAHFRPAHVGALCFITDALQAFVHRMSHTAWKRTVLGRSHMVHHEHRNPEPQEAFYTGFVDAAVQMLLPLLFAMWVVQPSRLSAVAFGCVYSWWLLFIHSDPTVAHPTLDRLCLVTPSHHHRHHQTLETSYASMFRFDKLQRAFHSKYRERA